MADIPGAGLGTETDPIGEGTAVILEPSTVPLVCILINTIEEIICFANSQYTVNEDAGELAVSFFRINGRAGRPLEFEILTEPATAVENLHYLPLESPVMLVEDEGEAVGDEGPEAVQRVIRILNAHMGVGVSKTLRLTIAPTPSRNNYTRGAPSIATITINGVGAAGQGGVLQFSVPSVSIPETAGTAPSTVQVTRTGTSGTPPAAQVTVTSTPGTATSPGDFTAVSATLNWASGDSAAKNVPITVANNAAAQGDKTLSLALSVVTGAQIGTLGAQTISIIDMTVPPSGVLYPLRGGLHIGDPHDNTSSAFLDKAATQDLVIIGVLPSRGMSYYQTACAALKARNPAIKVLLYWDPYFIRTNAGSQNPFTSGLINYFQAQTGIPGLGIGPNNWLAQRADGALVSRALYGTSYYPNFHPNTTPDAQGRRAFAYHLEWLKINVLDAVPAADGLYLDDMTHRDAEWAGKWVYQSNNVDVGPNDAAKRVSYRAGLKLGTDHWKNIAGTRKLLGNCGGWTLETANCVPAFSALQLDGITFEQRAGTNIATFGLMPSGNSIISNGVGNFANGLSKINHGLFATQNFRTRNPPLNMFIISGMPAVNRNSASGRAAGYRYFRYFFAISQVCGDLLFHGHDQAGGDKKSYEADAGVMADYDEYYGQSIAGTAFGQRLALSHWMGAALDPKQTSQTQQGCYRRGFTNAVVWMNPQGNGTKTLTIEAAGAGKVWRLIAGGQDPAVNTGAIVTGSYVLSDQNAVFLKRVAS